MERKRNKFCSPLRYPGGKSCIFKFMAQFLAENDLIGTDYAEPYAGGAGLALCLLMNEYVGDIFINDLDPSIYAFWHAVLNDADALCEWIEHVPVTVESWVFYKKIQEKYRIVDSLELAKSTLFLNRTNVSGVIAGGIIGGFNQDGKYKIDARFNKADLIRRISNIQRFSSRIHIYNLDGVDFVKKIEKMKRDIFIYLDPPYYKKGSYLYVNSFCDKDHQELANYVNTIHKKWLMSYDNQRFIKQLYEKKRKVLYHLSQCASNRVGDELLIFDDRLGCKESISQLKNALFV
ncbi:MAG: DNA adenine methylase [Succinivibrio sp.]|nr:DNA adenine methylase [Succinivibrio sp.]